MSMMLGAEEPREGFECAGHRADPRQRLRLAWLDSIGLDRRQPEQIEEPQIAAEQVGAQRYKRRKPARAVIPVVLGLQFLAQDVEDQVFSRHLQFGAIDFAEKTIKALPVN
jgi:hypothetical protein